LSIDFFIGISIFLIALIIAATMISGLLIGLQTKQIDFDAVAYRTGVILVEDPGEPSTGTIYKTLSVNTQWEFISNEEKYNISRFGLALYKSTPRVLSEDKVLRFFDPNLFTDSSEYRNRMIFGDYPYRFNITLKTLDGNVPYHIGDPFHPNSSYGYIRRVVLIKSQTLAGEKTYADIDMSPYYGDIFPISDHFLVNISYITVLDRSMGPQYWIEPTKEAMSFNLVNIQSIKNQSPLADAVTLNNIKITFEAKLLDGTFVSDINLPYQPFTVVIDHTNHNFTWPLGAEDGPLLPVNEFINITFPSAFFIPPSEFAVVDEMKMNVRYEFDPSTVNLTIPNTYFYSPHSPGFVQAPLIPAIMEVRVW